MKVLVIDKQAVKKNITVLKRRAEKSAIYAVLTGDAHGAGLVEMAKLLRDEGIVRYAVSEAADAAALAESMTNFGFDRALYGFEREGFSAIRDAYKARCVNLGRHVTFDGGEGTALDVDEEGRLVVQGAEGSTHVFTGEVSVHGIYGAV